MTTLDVRFKILREGARAPTYQTSGAAGADLRACIGEQVNIGPGETAWLPSGIAVEIPDGHVGLVAARSGLATRSGLAPANKVGVIDSDYRGEIFLVLYNHSDRTRTVSPGERVAQLIIVPVVRAAFSHCDDLSETDRQEGGFGSTGEN